MDPGDTTLRNQDRIRAARACQACRTSKVRCRRPNDDQPCSRCTEIGRHCIPREESNKRQKQLDSRSIESIDARLDELAEVLYYRDGATAVPAPIAERTTTLDPQPATASLSVHRTDVPSSSLSNEYTNAHIEQSIRDIVDHETTNLILSHFIENMLQHFPFMAFRPHSTTEVVLRTTPILLLAILDAAGDGFYDTRVSRNIRKLLVEVYSTCLPDTNAYRISLLQALIVSVVWHKDIGDPQFEHQMDVFQISHAAANMAIVMGMGKGTRWTSLEVRRLWLACYYICSSASMAMQTPNVMRWTRHMDECLEILDISDKVVCAHVRLQHIVEEFEAQLSSAPSPTAVDVTHRVAKRQIAEWTSTLNTWNDSLDLSQRFVKLYVHELSMTAMPNRSSSLDNSVTAIDISAAKLTECLAAAHNLLDAFLSLDMTLIRTLPASYFVQMTHTAIVLVKLHSAAAKLHNHGTSILKADDYLRNLIKKFSGWGPLWPVQNLARTFRKLQGMLQRRGGGGFTDDLTWLNSWTLAEPLSVELLAQTSMVDSVSGEGGPVSHDLETASRTALSSFDEELLAWSQSGPSQRNVIQDTAQNTLPSASLDATQLVDWFGTDLNTSTFDFDGDLQSMVQLFD